MNLQNIPSHNKNIRMMFVPQKDYVLIGGDFSQQEPRLLSAFSRDENMMNAYREGKDLYATMGVAAYGNDYWDNMEHHQDGSPYPEGKKRRSAMKILLLGISYGMGAQSIATDLKEKNPDGSTPPVTKQDIADANRILGDFYKGFPTVKKWKDDTEKNAKVNGYVEDLWGRRRRLPDLFLPKYEFRLKDKPYTEVKFNPLLGSTGKYMNTEKPAIITKYEKLLNDSKNYKDTEKIKKDAYKEGLTIIDHGAHISQAERQCVNARIQGSAASMSKIALRKVYDNERLKELGFKILLQIHDEFIGECPKENAEECSELLSLVMRTSVEDVVPVPFKCDVEQTNRWYEDEYFSNIRNDYKKLLGKGMSEEDAQSKIRKDNPESIVYDIKELLNLS